MDETNPVTSKGDSSGSHAPNLRVIRLGQYALKSATTYYVDNIAVDDADWVGAEALSIPIVMYYYKQQMRT